MLTTAARRLPANAQSCAFLRSTLLPLAVSPSGLAGFELWPTSAAESAAIERLYFLIFLFGENAFVRAIAVIEAGDMSLRTAQDNSKLPL